MSAPLARLAMRQQMCDQPLQQHQLSLAATMEELSTVLPVAFPSVYVSALSHTSSPTGLMLKDKSLRTPGPEHLTSSLNQVVSELTLLLFHCYWLNRLRMSPLESLQFRQPQTPA